MTLPIKPKITANAAQALESTDRADDRDNARSRLPQGFGKFLWPAVCLFQLGLLAGLYVTGSGHDPTSASRGAESQDASHADADGQLSSPPVQSFADTARADDLLKRGWYDQALARYRSSTRGQTGEMPVAVRFKIALCLEGLGHWDQALAEFVEVAGCSANEQLASAARLERARLWFRMRNTDESRNALCDLLMKPLSEAPAGTGAQVELCQLLGLTLATEAAGKDEPGPRSESSLARYTPDWRPESQLIWAEPPATGAPASPPQGSAANASLDFRRKGPAIHDCEVAVTGQRGTVLECIERLAQGANFKLDWTDLARSAADRRIVEISSVTLPWPTLVACLAEPIGIAWELKREMLYLSTYAEINDEDRAARRSETSRLILLAAAQGQGRGPETAGAYLGLGLLAFEDDELEMATTWFERILTEFPRSSQTVQAHFNLGVVRRLLGQHDPARKSFFHAIDTAPTHALAPLAHLFVGRIDLDDCNPEAAIAPLRRAVAMSAGTATRPAAVVDLATAMLLVQNWRPASAVLLEHHAVLSQPEYNDVVAFLGTYARYRALTDRKQLHREGQALVSALMGVKPDSVLHPCGTLLLGRAYADLGLSEQMAETFEQALRRGVPKSIAHEISHELAEVALTSGKHDEAKKHFTTVFEGANHARSRRAGLRIAEMALANERTDDCLEICRQLLEGADKSDLPVILRLMGRAFERSGDYQRAAQCFAGQPPAASSSN